MSGNMDVSNNGRGLSTDTRTMNVNGVETVQQRTGIANLGVDIARIWSSDSPRNSARPIGFRYSGTRKLDSALRMNS